MTFEFMLRQYESVKAGQGRLVDIIVGFIDPNAPDEIAAPVNPKLAQAAAAAAPATDSEEDEEGESGENSEDEEVLETGPDPEEAARRFVSIAKLHQQTRKALLEKGL
jgi:RNA polymerase primary sigma factor